MSNPMMPPQGPPPGMPPQGGGGMDVKSKMSIMNPTDLAAKVSKGDIRPDQTVAEFLQRNFGVSPQDPVQKLMQSLKSQAQNATMAGKMGAPQGPPKPMGAPAGPPSQPPGGMDDLIKQM